MGPLLILCQKFVELVEILVSYDAILKYLMVAVVYCASLLFQIGNFPIVFLFQKDGDLSKQDTVVLVLQDMLEVVTRDMMHNEVRLANIFMLFKVKYIYVCWHPSNCNYYILNWWPFPFLYLSVNWQNLVITRTLEGNSLLVPTQNLL